MSPADSDVCTNISPNIYCLKYDARMSFGTPELVISSVIGILLFSGRIVQEKLGIRSLTFDCPLDVAIGIGIISFLLMFLFFAR